MRGFRHEILAGRRGRRIGGLFDGLPQDIDWHRAALAPEEVLAIHYINWDWWLRISGGTRLATEAVRRIREGLVPGCAADDDRERQIAMRLQTNHPPPELIAVTMAGGPLVLVEGHVRLPADAFYRECLPPKLDVLLGISERVSEWSEY